MDSPSVPIIDFAPWRSPDASERQKCVDKVYEACTQSGFFYIKNHGIPQPVIDNIHAATKRMFALPEEVKMECYLGNSKKFHGYSPFGAELSTGAEIDDPAEAAGQANASEAFDIGYEIAGDATKDLAVDKLPQDPWQLYGDNQWPREEACPGFRDASLEWYREAMELSRDLMRVFARALGLEEAVFEEVMRYPGAMGRLIHYPTQRIQGQEAAGLQAHTDYECLTVLSQGSVPGLQVHNRKGEWIRVDPIPGLLVINISDCLAMWTNNRFKSTIHRVVNMTGEERYAVPFFFGVDYNATISVLENCITDDSPACTVPFQVGEYVRNKLSKAYVGYGTDPSQRAGKTVLNGASS